MDASGPASPPSAAGALLLVAGVWGLLLAAGAGRPGGDAELLAAVGLACAALLAYPPAARPRPAAGALLLAGAAGFASFPLGLAALGAIAPALGLGPPPAPREPGLLSAALQVGPGALLEELLYRERLLGALRPRLGTAGAVAASSAVFAAAHPEPWSALAALGAGAALGATFAATGCVALAAAAHAGLNLAACLWALA
jgi:membrane protease YdiL (CAAX protease family)